MLLLGTSFIDRFIKGIFPQDRKFVPFYSNLVAIVDILEQTIISPALNVENNVDMEMEERCHLVRVAKGIHIAPILEARVVVKT